MTRAVDLLRQGRTDELWQMCCGFTDLSLEQFMAIQERLLMEQVELLRHSPLGKKVLQGTVPRSMDEFRRLVPLTTYKDYCPDLLEKREDVLPEKPLSWLRTSGSSGEYVCRWVPITPAFSREMSRIMYGLGILASCDGPGQVTQMPGCPRMVYTVAPRPYTSGAMASMVELQTPVNYLPAIEEAEAQAFDERVKLGFRRGLAEGIDFFFGLSLVLAAVGDKFSQSSEKVDIRPLLRQPRALLRLGKGVVRSRLARRPLRPSDVWSVKGIVSSGLDSWVYRDKIKEMWGRYPLDVYIATEAGVIATQTWDYEGMTFIPDLNFLEFIPEKEHFKWQLQREYQPKTVLLDEVQAGEKYELVITNFHGGAMTRYRIGDMVRITSLKDEKTGIQLPQMVFERRADGLLNFAVVKLTEKQIWQAIQNTGIAYQDWTAYKRPGEQVLHLLVELKDGHYARESDLADAVRKQILDSSSERHGEIQSYWKDAIGFSVEATLLPRGAFASYISQRQAEGADLAHLKPPHINPSDKILFSLLGKPVAAPVATAGPTEKVPA